jgi:hypothetical protein
LDEEATMIHADPWNEIPRLESVVEADLLAAVEHARLHAAAETFCVRTCRTDSRCPLAGTLRSKEQCPLWMYVRTTALPS